MAKRLRDILLMFRDIPPTGAGNRAETEGVETCFDGRTGWLPRRRTCARWRGLLCLCGGRGVPGRPVYPQSVIRVQSDFVLPPCRLAVAFAEGVAGYVATKRQTRCRRQDERAWKAVERLSSTRQGGLTTDLGLSSVGLPFPTSLPTDACLAAPLLFLKKSLLRGHRSQGAGNRFWLTS